MPASILIAGAPQPTLDAPLHASLALTNAGGWANVAEVEWQLFLPSHSAAALTLVGPIVVAPFDNDFTPDVPGSYLVHLRILYDDGSTSTDRAVVQVQHPYANDPEDVTDGVAPPAPFELGNDPDAGTSYPTRDATNGWSQAAERAIRVLLDQQGRGGVLVPVYNGGVADITAFTVVRPASERTTIVEYTGGAGGLTTPGAPETARWLVDVEPVDGTSATEMAPGHALMLLLGPLPVGARGLAVLEGLVPRVPDMMGAGALPFPVGGPLWVQVDGKLTTLWSPGGLPPAEHVGRSVGELVLPAGLDNYASVFFSGRPYRDQRRAAFTPDGHWYLDGTAGGPKGEVIYTAADLFAHFDITTGGGVTNAGDLYASYTSLTWLTQWRADQTGPLLRMSIWAEAANSSCNLAIYRADKTMIALKNLSASIPVGVWTEYSLDYTDFIVATGIDPLRPGERFTVVLTWVTPYPDWADGQHLKFTVLAEGPAAVDEW